MCQYRRPKRILQTTKPKKYYLCKNIFLVIVLDKNSIIANEPVVATIGFFDGIHLGHRFLINALLENSALLGCRSMIVSFNSSPKKTITPNSSIFQLHTATEKMDKLKEFGVNYSLLFDFDCDFAKQTAKEFLSLLSSRFNVKYLLVGYDHTFGADKVSDFEIMSNICDSLGVKAIKIEQFKQYGKSISSSMIRKLIESRDFAQANSMLGYSYQLTGTVVEGQKIGRTIGFPTANLDIDSTKLIPHNGVYAVKVIVGDEVKHGMLNIGNRPTVNGQHTTVEVNIFDFDRYIYGDTLSVQFVKFIRDEKKFSSLDMLQNQLFIDKKTIKKIL